MVETRWMVDKTWISIDNEKLQVVEVYASKEKRKVAQRENRHIAHKLEEILVKKNPNENELNVG